jgi:hypothetical protein
MVLKLRHHAQDIGSIALQHVGVALVFRGRFREVDMPTPRNGEASTQYVAQWERS